MLDFNLRKVVEKLGEDLVDVFASPQYIPGCQVLGIANIDEYATNNGWVDALCGVHNRQQVRYQGFPAGVQVDDYIDVEYFPNYKLFVCFGSGGTASVASGSETLTYNLQTPGTADEIPIGFFFEAITVSEVQAAVKGTSPSVTIDPYHTLDVSGTATNNDVLANPGTITDTGAGQNITSFDDATIPADSWLVLKTTATSGTPTDLIVSFRYTR